MTEPKKLSDARLGELQSGRKMIGMWACSDFIKKLASDLFSHCDALTAENEWIKKLELAIKPEVVSVYTGALPQMKDTFAHEYNELRKERDRLSQECAVYREALEKYQKEDHHLGCYAQREGMVCVQECPILIADEALAKGEGIRSGK